MEELINAILFQMQRTLSPFQLKELKRVLIEAFSKCSNKVEEKETDLIAKFLVAKEVEGRSQRTLTYYESTLRHMEEAIEKPFTLISTDDLRRYLNEYAENRHISKVTVDNIRRILIIWRRNRSLDDCLSSSNVIHCRYIAYTRRDSG